MMASTLKRFGWIDKPLLVKKYLSKYDIPNFKDILRYLPKQRLKTTVFWDREIELFEHTLEPTIQGNSDCVSVSVAHACQELLFNHSDLASRFPLAMIASEPIHGITQSHMSASNHLGNGCPGVYGAIAVRDVGVLIRDTYSSPLTKASIYDLTNYSPRKSKDWGKKGLSTSFKDFQFLDIVQDVALVTDVNSALQALMLRMPITVGSHLGFDFFRNGRGFVESEGQMNYQFLVRGYVQVKLNHGYAPGIALQLYWKNTVKGTNTVISADTDSIIEFPSGVFLVNLQTFERMLEYGDSFVYCEQKNWGTTEEFEKPNRYKIKFKAEKNEDHRNYPETES